MSKIAIVYFSAFHGHTKILAEYATQGAASVAGCSAHLFDVAQVIDWDALNQCDAIIFGSPTYMGSVAAPFKQFMDDSSPVWASRVWKDKLAAGFTCSHGYSGDKLNVLVQMVIFAAQHGMIWVGVGDMQEGNGRDDINRIGGFLGAMAQADTKDPEPLPPDGDRQTVFNLGKRVAALAQRLSQ